MFFLRGIALFILLLLSACASRQPPIIIDRTLSGAAVHTVVAGDTLYSIALRYDKDYHDIARINGLDSNFLIRPGQRLRLEGEAAPRVLAPRTVAATIPKTVPAVPKTESKTSAKVESKTEIKTDAKSVAKVEIKPEIKTDTKPQAKPSAVTVIAKPSVAPLPPTVEKKPEPVATPAVFTPVTSSAGWSWPAKGQVAGRFGGTGLAGKGIDILGKRGEPVRAAADGTIVYAGSGLVGYGKLLIVRHDDTYISAYAHNERFLVAEGDAVKGGQPIAEMGASSAERDKLHFEIRERGKPVDPLKFLPAR